MDDRRDRRRSVVVPDSGCLARGIQLDGFLVVIVARPAAGMSGRAPVVVYMRADSRRRGRGGLRAGSRIPPALHTLIGKVATSPARVTDADFAAAKAAGFSEDQLFELVISAAVGQSTRLYEAGLAALAEAVGHEEGR